MLILKNRTLSLKIGAVSQKQGWVSFVVEMNDGSVVVPKHFDLSDQDAEDTPAVCDFQIDCPHLRPDDFSVGVNVEATCDVFYLLNENGDAEIRLGSVKLLESKTDLHYFKAVYQSGSEAKPSLSESILQHWIHLLREADCSIAFVAGYQDCLTYSMTNAVDEMPEGYQEYFLKNPSSVESFQMGLMAGISDNLIIIDKDSAHQIIGQEWTLKSTSKPSL